MGCCSRGSLGELYFADDVKDHARVPIEWPGWASPNLEYARLLPQWRLPEGDIRLHYITLWVGFTDPSWTCSASERQESVGMV